MAKARKVLTEFDVFRTHELSIVDAGANRKGRFPITKSKGDPMTIEEILKAALDVPVDGEDSFSEILEKAKVSEKGMAAAKGALRILSAFKDEIPGDVLAKLSEIAGVVTKEDDEDENKNPFPKADDEKAVKKWLADVPEELKKALIADPPADKEPIMKGLEGLSKEAQGQVEVMLKAQNDKIEALETKNAENTEALVKAKDARELSEWVQKAKDDLAHFPGSSAEEAGELLKSLHDLDPEKATKQFETMKKASAAFEKSSLLTTVGKAAREEIGTGSAYSELLKKADSLVEKSAGDMSKEQAFTKAVDMYPKLYTKYLEENEQQTE